MILRDKLKSSMLSHICSVERKSLLGLCDTLLLKEIIVPVFSFDFAAKVLKFENHPRVSLHCNDYRRV